MYREVSLLTLALMMSQASKAETVDTEGDHEKVVVTATRNPLPASELGATVIVLQRADLEMSGAKTVTEALRGLPGLAIRRSGGAGSNAEILIRGDKGGHTMVLVDGFEQADVSSIEKNFDIGDMPLSDVDRIEIVKGPHSVAYGASGLSGVIHIITRRPEKSLTTNFGISGGSYDSFGSHLRLSGREGELGYSLSFSGQKVGGYSHTGSRDDDEADGFSRSDGRLRLQYGQKEGYSADLVIDGAQSVTDLDGGADSDDRNFVVKSRGFGSNILQKIRFLESFETRLGAAISKTDRRYFDDPDQGNPNRDQTWERSRFRGERRTLDFGQSAELGKDQSLIGSVQWINDSAEIENHASYQGFAVDSELPQESIKEYSYALQYQWGLWDRIYGQWGVRSLDHSKYREKTVGQVAFNILLVPEWTTLRLNYGRGFKTPSLYQLRAPVYGNNDLRPEYAISGEVGIEQKFGTGVTASMTGFQSDTLNLIQFDGNASRYYNVNRGLIKGIESTLAWDLTNSLSATAQYTHLSTLDQSTNRPLPSRPDDAWGGDITWKENDYSWKTMIRGQTRSRAQPYVEGTEGFRVVDTSLLWHQNSTRLGLRINNLLNSWYREVAGFNTPARNFSLLCELTL